MCGIAGIFLFGSERRRLVPNLHAMGLNMRRRGPDGEGYLIAAADGRVRPLRGDVSPVLSDGEVPFLRPEHVRDVYDEAATLFLGHRRLSIIDLSPMGHQPMCTSCGRYWIVYNGEIYNYREVRTELAGIGVVFHGNSDTEVLVNAYKHWGADCLEKLNGMFAFALWDAAKERLVLARDRVGIKPLYYCLTGSGLVFASDIKTIIESGLYDPQVDIRGLYYAISFGVAPRPMTSFKGVKELRQGSYMEFGSEGHRRSKRYWRLPRNERYDPLSLKESIDRVESELKAAVRRRLVADVPVGCYLSGGLDSTIVASMAGEIHSDIYAYTLGFSDHKEKDETSQARDVARKYGLLHHVRDVASDKVLQYMDEMVECYEEPYYGLSPSYVISQFAAEKDAKVILSGLGGDEIFGGYPYYGWEHIWRAMRLCRPIFSAMKSLGPLRHLSERVEAMGLADKPAKFALAVRSFFSEGEKQRLFGAHDIAGLHTINDMFGFYECEGVGGSFQEQIGHADMSTYIPNHHLYRGDKFSMHFSLEMRFPMLDHEFIEAVSRVPSKWKMRNGTRKWLLRKVGERYLPESCLKMKKKGFSLPLDTWARTTLSGFVEDNLRSLAARGFLDEAEIMRTYREWKSRLRGRVGLWQLVATELWLQKFIDAPRPGSLM